MKICSNSECNRIIDKHGAKGLCSSHYKRFKVNSSLTGKITERLKPNSNKICTISNCKKVAKAKLMCSAHWYLWKKHGDPTIKRTSWGDPIKRLWSLVEKTDSCWLWKGLLNQRGAYGVYRHKYAHRVVYELVVGKIPKNLVLDHICRIHNCVNPKHLRVITRGENADSNRIKTHCPTGHAYNKENTYIDLTGGRRCRKCNQLRYSLLSSQKTGKQHASNLPLIYTMKCLAVSTAKIPS